MQSQPVPLRFGFAQTVTVPANHPIRHLGLKIVRFGLITLRQARPGLASRLIFDFSFFPSFGESSPFAKLLSAIYEPAHRFPSVSLSLLHEICSCMKHKRHAMLMLAAPLVFTACATMAPPQPPSLELPKPPTDLHASRKGDKVILTWTVPGRTTDRQRIHTVGQTRICRGLEAQLTQCGTPVGEAKPQSTAISSSVAKPSAAKSSAQKVTVTYTDTLPTEMESDDPAAFVTYAVEVLNVEGRGAGTSNQVRVPTIRTLPPPEDFAAKVTSKGIELTWTNDVSAASARASAANGVRYVYRVYRRAERSGESSVIASIPIASVPVGGAPRLTLTDSNFEWEKTYWYRAETATVIAQANKPEQQIEGADTPEVKVFADDVFPPAVPSGLQAVFSGPGQEPFIDLIWAPVTDADLDGYNVYRREEGSAPVKLNTALVKTPAYRDPSVQAGKTYLYSVTAVDFRGNESARSEEAGERVP
jgi:hypothetical protein